MMGRKRQSPSSAAASFAYEGLDRVIHEKARLGILTSLITHPAGLVFNELKDFCGLTDGNLSRHLTALESARLIDVWKGSKDRYPQTLYRLTDDGRRRFLSYIEELEQVVQTAQKAHASRREISKPSQALRPA
jgi:DNA-binding HxlR family transcriptional regulator